VGEVKFSFKMQSLYSGSVSIQSCLVFCFFYEKKKKKKKKKKKITAFKPSNQATAYIVQCA